MRVTQRCPAILFRAALISVWGLLLLDIYVLLSPPVYFGHLSSLEFQINSKWVNSLLGVNCLQSLMMTAFVVFHEKSHLLSTKARVQDRDSRFNRHFLSNSLQYWCTLCDCSADNLTELVFFTMTVWECVGVLSVFNPYSRKNAIDSWTLSCITWRNWIWE